MTRTDSSSDGRQNMADTLSQRERQILVYATAGLTDQAMANKLGISRATVTTYWGRIRTKFGAYGRTELVANYVREQANLRHEGLVADEGLFRGIAESSPFGIFFADPESNCLYANPKWLELSGLTAEEALGDGWQKAIHPEDLERVRKLWVTTRNQQIPYESKTRYVRPDGNIVWVTTRAVARYEHDVLVGYLGTCEDITRAELALAEVEQRKAELEDLIQMTPNALISIDDEMKIVRVNPATESLFGYTAEELLGRDLEMLVPSQSRAKHLAGLKEFAGSGVTSMTVDDGEYISAQTKGGKIVCCEGNFIRHTSSSNTRFTAILKDVTAKLEAEAKHEASQAKYRALVATISHFVWTATPDAMVIHGSDWFSQFAGVDLESLSGRGWTQIVHPDDVAAVIQGARQAALEKRSWEFHARLRRKDGEYRWHYSRVTPILDSDGCVSQWVGATMDVHDERQTAKELCSAQRLLDSTPDIVVTAGVDGKITFANLAARALRSDNLNSLDDLFSPLTVREINSNRAQPIWIGEGMARNRDGSEFPVSLVCVAGNPEECGTSIIARGLHGGVRTEGRGPALDRVAKVLADTSLDLVYIYRLSDSATVYVSEACERTTGYSPDELRDMGPNLPALLIHPDDLTSTAAKRSRVAELADGGILEYEYRMIKSTGQTRWCRTRATPLTRNEDGSVDEVLAVVTDITAERRLVMRLEDRIRTLSAENEDLERSLTEAKSKLDDQSRDMEMVATALRIHVSRSLRGCADHLARLDLDGTPDTRPRLSTILQRVTAIARNASEISDCCFMLSHPLKPERVDAARIARQVWDSIVGGAECRCDLLISEDLTFDADPELLRFAFRILFEESFVATQNLERPLITLDAYRTTNRSGLRIRDNRILSPDHLSGPGDTERGGSLRMHCLERQIRASGGSVLSEPTKTPGFETILILNAMAPAVSTAVSALR